MYFKKFLRHKNASPYCLYTDEIALVRRICPPFYFVNVMTDSVMDIWTVTFFANFVRHILCKGHLSKFSFPSMSVTLNLTKFVGHTVCEGLCVFFDPIFF
jgi:hypothetical protein